MAENEKLVAMVQAAQRGEEQGATALYDTFYQDIYYYIFKIVKNQDLAADLTQDTFMDILQKIGTLREPEAFVSWSRQVAYSRCTAYFRKRRELLADEDEDGYSVFDTLEEERTEFIPDAALDQEDLKATIHAMLDTLPEEQSAALMMRYFEEMSVSQIAAVQGVSEGTVKSRLNYGRKAIGKAVEEYEKKHGIKLHCVGVVPLLLWLFAQGKGATTTTVAASSATTVAAGTGLATKLVAGGVALALVAGGVTGAVLLWPKDQPASPKSMVWSGFGEAETPVKNKHFQMTLTELTDDTISGHLDVTYSYEEIYSTDFTGTGAVEDDGTIHYQLQCEKPVSGGTSVEAELIYDPETENMVFQNIYFYQATMERWPLAEGDMISREEEWTGVGTCDFCRSDDHRFSIEIYEMTEISIRGKITMSAGSEVEHSSEFTARGYRQEGGSYYEGRLASPWEQPSNHVDYTLRSFWMTYDQRADSLMFHGMWYNAELKRSGS